MTPAELSNLTRHIKHNIPLTQHLAFELTAFQHGELQVTAPLAPNRNDKGTMFAGSLSTLCTLSGWALATLLANAEVDVLAVENHIRFMAPVDGGGDFRARVSDDAASRLFAQRLTRKGRARLRVRVSVCVGEKRCAEFEGSYLVQRITPDNS